MQSQAHLYMTVSHGLRSVKVSRQTTVMGILIIHKPKIVTTWHIFNLYVSIFIQMLLDFDNILPQCWSCQYHHHNDHYQDFQRCFCNLGMKGDGFTGKFQHYFCARTCSVDWGVAVELAVILVISVFCENVPGQWQLFRQSHSLENLVWHKTPKKFFKITNFCVSS